MPDPIVHQDFDPKNGILSFYTYDVLTKLLRDLVEEHPQLAQLESIGKSLESRELWMVTLTNQSTGPALERKIVRPIEAELNLPEEVSLVSGQRRQELGQLEGRSNKLWVWWSSASPTDNLCKIEWVLKGPQGSKIDLTIRSQRAGVIHQTVVLEQSPK